MKFTLFFLIFCTSIGAQSQYPKDYFRSPLDIPLQLSGNFGELRSNHFHAGFDFKTQQKEGFNVYAVADGYVSRIKISPFGYGKAIYINHPNGYTTVYGHLKNGSAKIESYLKTRQYQAKSFEIELFPAAGELPVKKGDMIALSGNTGGSGGPHLHFEIRDTPSEKVINPMYFGFNSIIIDTKKPVITNLVVYPMDENVAVNRSANPILIDIKTQQDGSYVSEKVLTNGKIGFGINAYDISDYSYSKNGIFKVESFSNGNSSFSCQFDAFAFDESRYINAYIDYSRYKRMSQRVQKLFMKQPYPLSIIKSDSQNGIIYVGPNMAQVYRIEVSDFNGNKSVVSIPIEFSALPANTLSDVKKTPYLIKTDKEYNFEKDNVSVYFPAKTFYEDFYLNFDAKGKELSLHNDLVAVHSNFRISIIDSLIPENEKEKTFIASVKGSSLSYNATKNKGATFTAYTRNMGQFKLAKDTSAPIVSISKSIEGKWISDQKTLVFHISDSLSGIKDYNGYLNGKWILFEYDYKTKRITHNFQDGIAADGRNDLKIVVSDNVGNSTIFETHFFRSQK